MSVPREETVQIKKYVSIPCQAVVKYLGIKIRYPLDVEIMINLKVNPVINDVQNKLEKWQSCGLIELLL